MHKPSATAILSALLALSWIGFLASSPRAQENGQRLPKRWEYIKIQESDLDVHGKQGWEAYAVIPVVKNGNLLNATYCMKREKP